MRGKRRSLFNLQGSPVDNGRPVVAVFCRGSIESQEEWQGTYRTTLIVGRERFRLIAHEEDVARDLAQVKTGGKVALYGQLRQIAWETQRDGPRERIEIEVQKMVPYDGP